MGKKWRPKYYHMKCGGRFYTVMCQDHDDKDKLCFNHVCDECGALAYDLKRRDVTTDVSYAYLDKED